MINVNEKYQINDNWIHNWVHNIFHHILSHPHSDAEEKALSQYAINFLLFSKPFFKFCTAKKMFKLMNCLT